LSWRRLGVLVRQLPPTSRLAREQHGDAVRWGDTEHLLAGIFDLLAGANWQRGGGKGQRPKPVKRPTDKKNETRYGTAMPPEQAKAKLRLLRFGEAS